jgi:hypothetical protein
MNDVCVLLCLCHKTIGNPCDDNVKDPSIAANPDAPGLPMAGPSTGSTVQASAGLVRFLPQPMTPMSHRRCIACQRIAVFPREFGTKGTTCLQCSETASEGSSSAPAQLLVLRTEADFEGLGIHPLDGGHASLLIHPLSFLIF